MTHYLKLAALMFRVVGVIFSISAALIFVLVFIGFLFWLYDEKTYNNWLNLLVSYELPTIIAALIFLLLSKKFAKWICFDFNKFDEQQ